MDRSAYLTSLIGRRWEAQGQGPDSYSCWSLFREVEKRLWGRDVPSVAIPPSPSWRWMIDTISAHPERGHWAEVPTLGGIVTAGDGAGVLMARADRAAHIGVWLGIERGVLHADQTVGVVFEGLSALRARGWGRLRFFEPSQEA